MSGLERYLPVRRLAFALLAAGFCIVGQSDGAKYGPPLIIHKIIGLMDQSLASYIGGDVSAQICPVLPVDLRDEVLHQDYGSLHIETGTVEGAADVVDGSRIFTITRSSVFQYTQGLSIIVEPNGKCSAILDKRSVDL